MTTIAKDDDNSSKESIGEEIEEAASISEDISIGSDSISDKNINLNAKKRHLFDIDQDVPNSSSFNIDDEHLDDILAGENIAKHFQISEKDDDDEKSNEVDKEELAIGGQEEERQILQIDQDSVESRILIGKEEKKLSSVSGIINKSSQSKKGNSDKDISPFKDGIILLNNEKVSLDSLKKQMKNEDLSDTTNQNTTNDVSDILIDDDVSLTSHNEDEKERNISRSKSLADDPSTKNDNLIDDRASKSLGESVNLTKFIQLEQKTDKKINETQKDSSFEEDHSIEEMIVSNASIEVSKNEDDEYSLKIKEVSIQKLDISSKDLSSGKFKRKISKDLSETDKDNIKTISDIDDILKTDPENTNLEIDKQSQMNKIINETIDNLPLDLFHSDSNKNQANVKQIINETISQLPDDLFKGDIGQDSLDSLSDGISNLKETILKKSDLKETPKSKLLRDYSFEDREDSETPPNVLKQMELADSSREALEDITEESDQSDPKVYHVTSVQSSMQKKGEEFRRILGSSLPDDFKTTQFYGEASGGDTSEINHDSFDSVISLNMLLMLENRVKDLQTIVSEKDLCLTALNMQLESISRRDSLKELPPSGRDSCSLGTTSTEYRTYPDEYINKIFDFQNELSERDQLIEKLTGSLQQSMRMCERLQDQNDKHTSEISLLRKQQTELRPHWMRDQESVGQRISEISIDLVSESDDAVDDVEKTSTDIESQRNSKERQLDIESYQDSQSIPLSKQIEQFKKYLSSDESRIFFMVQSKFDDYLSQEVEKIKVKYESDVKGLNEQVVSEKQEKESEINRLRNLLASIKTGSTELIELRRELDEKHGKEMEDLRTYFEKKCTELEKQYSEDIFSQHSRRHSNDTGSELSDQEQLPYERSLLHQGSPKRKKKGDILASPIHKKLTPTSIEESPPLVNRDKINIKTDETDPVPTIEELKIFYCEKISEINKNHDEKVKNLKLRLKYFECRHSDDDYTTQPKDDVTNNDSQVIRQIVEEYEKRLNEQVTLAKEDVLHALEEQIQALLSETATDDSRWPSELILLREKFTAKSQLEIAQLQIKHEEEMERLKHDYEKQLHRKLKRHTTFDTNRDIDQVLSERDNLRELCSTFRELLRDLAKCISNCEIDLNNTLVDELQRCGIDLPNNDPDGIDLNYSIQSNGSRKSRFVPDVSGILTVVEDPSLVNFVDQNDETNFNLNECLQRLKNEAFQLLQLSENLYRKNRNGYHSEKDEDSCEEESDGLKHGSSSSKRKDKTTNSLSETLLTGRERINGSIHRSSLPMNYKFDMSDKTKTGPNSEINVRLNELKNQLVHSETERKNLAAELAEAVRKYENLSQMLCLTKEHLENLDAQKDEISEGYGISQLQSPSRHLNMSTKSSYTELQNTARNILNSAPNASNADGTLLLQQIESFCGKLDKFVEEEKTVKSDLQEQIDAADKQKKATLQFLEEQAAEREQERDDFTKEIDNLKGQLREKDKECNSYIRIVKEAETMEQQIREMTLTIASYEDKKQKLETDLRASVDKIFDLREIISELEKQIENKSKNEHVLNEQLKIMESHINLQANKNSSLQEEVDSLKNDITAGYQEKILNLEEQVRSMRPSAEQSMIIDQMSVQLREIETSLERKTKNLESLHSAICSAPCSSPSEDVSVHGTRSNINSPAESPRTPRSLPVDDVQRIMDKLIKHNRAEEAAIKRIHDLEMQISNVRTGYIELQHERDILQEKMSEQIVRISSLQSRLDEQRHRAEELHRQGTSDLNVKVYDLQTQLTNVQEKLTAREKQIVTLKDHLEQSKIIIDRLEAELANGGTTGDQSKLNKLEAELKMKTEEISKLKEKMRSEMINKLALPDLMETMLADKNEEIDHLKEQLDNKQAELKIYLDLNLDDHQLRDLQNAAEITDGKSSGRTLSDIVSLSEYEADVARKAVDPKHGQSDLNVPSIGQPELTSKFFTTIESPKPTLVESNLLPISQQQELGPYFGDLSAFPRSGLTPSPSPQPRQINFSTTADSDRKFLGGGGTTTQSQQTQKTVENIDETNNNKTEQELAELREKLSTLSALESEVERLKIDNENKIQQINEIKLKIDENSELQLDLAAKSKLLTDLMNDKKLLQTELDDLKQKSVQLLDTQQELVFVRSMLLEKEQELAKFNENGNTNLTEMTDKLANVNCENEKLKEQIELLKQQVNSLSKTISHKDELLSKHEKNSLNFAQIESSQLEIINKLKQELLQVNQEFNREQYDTDVTQLKENLELTKSELFEKMIAYEKCQLYLKQQTKTIEELKDMLSDSKSPRSVEEMRIQIRTEQERNLKLQQELNVLKHNLQRYETSESPKHYLLDEIAKKVEKELNYSAQLDSNILKAIESDEVNSDDEKIQQQFDEVAASENVISELSAMKQKYENERKNCLRLQRLLDAEKNNSTSMQEQDSNIIQAINLRLEAALTQETELQKMLEEERGRNERLNTQLLVYQRASSRDNSLILKSPQESPRRTQRSNDFEFDLASRLQSEIKMLTSQNERERERIMDIERVMEREKSRFEKELADRKDYGEQMKKEADRLLKEKETLENQLEHAQERLSLSAREIESLESRITSLQEAESRRVARRGKERVESTHMAVEMQELKLRLSYVEKERDKLQEKIMNLREELERSIQREAQLSNQLAKEHSGEGIVPKQFLQKLNNMNSLIVDNTKENRQLSETLQILTTERQGLQQKIVDLEMKNRAFNREELEERANHLFGKYLRVESYRKALVHQKKYLLIVLQTYQDNEAKALAMINGNHSPKRKHKSFRAAVFAVIAIERMKYIVRRWQVGRRVASKAIFSHQVPRRSASASTNTWVRSDISVPIQSPPSRDRPTYLTRSTSQLPIRPLQSPSLIAECSERLESLAARSRWS